VETTNRHSSADRYEIVIREKLDNSWKEWFGDLELSSAADDQGNPFSILTGPVVDQAALNGILTKIWNLNLTVLSVNQID
jgi:hypothetical protein